MEYPTDGKRVQLGGASKSNATQESSVYKKNISDEDTYIPEHKSGFKILRPSESKTDPCGMTRNYYRAASSNVEEKVILLLGASGSGKTTLLDFVANYFEGVKTPDPEKIVVVSNRTKANEIIAYTFYDEKDTNSVITIIVTPGLNDSSGSEIRENVNSLKTFLANTATHNIKIHLVGFVVQAHIVRLTSTERLVMDYVSTIFGESVKENVITLISFADLQASPPVVEAITAYGMNIKHFFKFNNAVLNNASDEIDELDKVYWRTGFKSWKKVMKILKDVQPLSAKTMSTIQKDVYTKASGENSLNQLNDGMLEFISMKKQGIIEKVRKSSHNVWNLATIVHHLLKDSSEGSATVENLLLESLKKAYGSNKRMEIEMSLKALSYYSPRGAEVCTREIIHSIYPVYSKYVKTKDKDNEIDISIIVNSEKWKLVYCYDCSGYHIMEQSQGVLGSIKKLTAYTKSSSQSQVHTQELLDNTKKHRAYTKPSSLSLSKLDSRTQPSYKCNDCNCPDAHHVNKPIKLPRSFGEDDVIKILLHTKDRLKKVSEEYALPDSNLTEKCLLNFLMNEADAEVELFVNKLLTI